LTNHKNSHEYGNARVLHGRGMGRQKERLEVREGVCYRVYHGKSNGVNKPSGLHWKSGRKRTDSQCIRTRWLNISRLKEEQNGQREQSVRYLVWSPTIYESPRA